MLKHFKPAFAMLFIWTVMTGVFYPTLVTGLAQIFFPYQANGSVIEDNQGNAVGSALIGQSFSSNWYFWGRPSATSPFPYNAGASSGSNLGPTNPALTETVKAWIAALHAADSDNQVPIPVDLVTASGSGLDPHISPEAAEYQINRIAKARHIDPAKLRELVQAHIESRQWGLFGEPRVNVLALNRALDTSAK